MLGNLLKLVMVFYAQKMMSRKYHLDSSFTNHSFAIKRRRDNVKKKKKTENVNEDTIGNEIVTSDQLVNAMQSIFSYAGPEYTKNVIYFVKRTIGD